MKITGMSLVNNAPPEVLQSVIGRARSWVYAGHDRKRHHALNS